ncbi:MAG TPA: hypothetical protein VL096_17305, partial [Pirellulaceae bacterium]|nr:hypothetical protein [Pirellulaceae bacterium]
RRSLPLQRGRYRRGRRGRDIALGVMGTLARSPLGGLVIDFLGHMRPPQQLACTAFGRRLVSPIGFGPELDPQSYALPALQRFGVGFVEVGPVGKRDRDDSLVRRDDAAQTIITRPGYTAIATDKAHVRLQELANDLLLILRVELPFDSDEAWEPDVVAMDASALTIDEATGKSINHAFPATPILLTLHPSCSLPVAKAAIEHLSHCVRHFAGILITGGDLQADQTYHIGAPAREPTLHLVRGLRAEYRADQLAIIAGGGIHEPQHALDLFAAGANLVKLDSGLIFSGPGLAKRINEALVVQHAERADATLAAELQPPPRYAWYWLLLLGLAMFSGGILALIIAATQVVLPYDEQFVGMTRAALEAINPRLLSFMTHDRVTLAGTMLSIAVLYLGLTWYGVRRGEHWAYVAVFSSALTGFFSFFVFLVHGYFEPFHAFVTAIMFQFLLMAWHAPLPPRQLIERVPLREDWRMRLGWWGQLGLIIESLAVLTAGVVICTIGSTSVLVQEDLIYMNTCSEALSTANPRLLALIAHDRATFGGMLVACGLTTLMAALWGFAAGRAWLFWTLLLAGTIGYACTLAVHYGVGYVDLKHLAPAYGGLALHWLSLALAAPYLLQSGYRLQTE